MILIADSGSTKTTWMVVETGNKMVTQGLNPHFTTARMYAEACAKVRDELVHGEPVEALHFYGAGCGDEGRRSRVAQKLRREFGCRHVEVQTDLMGACRAVCPNGEEALVGILGTGSNACYYDGKKPCYQPLSTGYILGDHGSANHVGRQLLQDYLSGMLGEGLIIEFRNAFPYSDKEFIDAVYHSPHPNRFLAEVGRFAAEHYDVPPCDDYIDFGLMDWDFYQLSKPASITYCNKLHVVGGFAAHIKPALHLFAKEFEYTLGAIVADPINGLREHHIKKI